jgi:hypothetical protein
MATKAAFGIVWLILLRIHDQDNRNRVCKKAPLDLPGPRQHVSRLNGQIMMVMFASPQTRFDETAILAHSSSLIEAVDKMTDRQIAATIRHHYQTK